MHRLRGPGLFDPVNELLNSVLEDQTLLYDNIQFCFGVFYFIVLLVVPERNRHNDSGLVPLLSQLYLCVLGVVQTLRR